jgi:hypothetical protein
MFEAQATTGRTAIARHFASCDILPRSAWPTESRRAGLARNSEAFTTPVDVRDGRVTLTGVVGSAIAKSRASDDAWVNGVLAVDDSGMKVEPCFRDVWATQTMGDEDPLLARLGCGHRR